MPASVQKDLAYFHQYAYAIPRDTKLTWKYEPDKVLVTTTWTITTEPLQGSEKAIIQGLDSAPLLAHRQRPEI